MNQARGLDVDDRPHGLHLLCSLPMQSNVRRGPLLRSIGPPAPGRYVLLIDDGSGSMIALRALSGHCDPRLEIAEEARCWEAEGWNLRRSPGMRYVGFQAERHGELRSVQVRSLDPVMGQSPVGA